MSEIDNKNFPMFGNITDFILHSEPRVYINENNSITFDFRDEDLKEFMYQHGLNPDNYTIFEDKIEYTPLLVYALKDLNKRLTELENEVRSAA